MKLTKAVKASSPLLTTTTTTTTTTTIAMISKNPPIPIATVIATKTTTVIVIVTMTGATVIMTRIVTKIRNETEIDAIKTVSTTRMLSLTSVRGWRNLQSVSVSVRKRNSDSRILVYLNLNFR